MSIGPLQRVEHATRDLRTTCDLLKKPKSIIISPYSTYLTLLTLFDLVDLIDFIRSLIVYSRLQHSINHEQDDFLTEYTLVHVTLY